MARRFRSISRIALAAVLLLAAGTARGAICKKVSARIEAGAVTDPSQCNSSIALCAAGTVKGLKGTWSFTGTSLLQSVDTPTTSVVFFTGDEVYFAPDGDNQILVKSAGAVGTAQTMPKLASVDVILGGTGAWAGATGSFTATGTLVGGAFELEVEGEICTP